MDDMASGLDTPDIPSRFLPALIAGLAYYLSLKVPNGLQRSELLKAQYDEQWGLASDEDREKAPLRITPRVYN